MILIVDKNEKDTNPRIVQLLEKYFSQVIVTNLPHRDFGNTSVTAGDINIPLDDGSILAIERKTPDDFLNSIASGHLFDQIEVMSNNAKYSAVIITGKISYGDKNDMVFADDEQTNWKGASVRAVFNVIQYSGCALIFCPPKQYPMMIAEIYNTVNKPDKRQSIRKNRVVTFPPVDERLEFIAQLPGIGLKLADSLLLFAGMMDKNADELGYGTVASALHWATILSQIDKESRPAGWGAAKILTVRKFFGLSESQYIGLDSEE